MRITRSSLRVFAGFLALVLAAALSSFAQDAAPAAQAPAQGGRGPAPAGRVRMAEEQYKNIKVLTGTPANQLNLGMHNIAGQLGVDCVFCHTWEQFDKDGKPNKEIARRMMTMVRDMNKTYFGGAQVISCYTCHRGSPKPVSVRIIPDIATMRSINTPPPPLPVEEKPFVPPNYPTVQAILDKYVQALGGEAALRKVTSRVIVAKRDYPFGAAGLTPIPADVEIYEQAPNLVLMTSKTEKFTVSEGYDADGAWAQNQNGGVNALPEPDQQRAKRVDDFYEPLDMAKNYDSMVVVDIEKVGAKDCYVVLATPANDTPERLYFDVKTGLLVRRLTQLPSTVGPFPYAVDYDDYKKTGGVMFPFTIRMNPSTPRNEASTNSTIQILSVKDNVAIDAAKFTRPPSKAPAGGGGRGGPGAGAGAPGGGPAPAGPGR